MAYDAVWVLVQAIEMAKTVDREKVVEALLSGKFKTLRGTIHFRKEDQKCANATNFWNGSCVAARIVDIFGIDVNKLLEMKT